MQLCRVALLSASVLLSFLAFIAGCDSNATSGAAAAAGASGAGGAPTGGSGPGASSGSGGTDPGIKVTTTARSMGPLTAESGEENTQCVTVNLNNPDTAYVLQIRSDLGA